MNKVIKNAKIVNSRDTYCADVRIQDGVIAEIGQNITPEEGCTVIDAAGKYLIPGAVDGHTHMMDPGYTDRETFAQGTAAAAVGGTTTVIDHHRTDPLVHTAEILREKIEYLSDKAVVDFGLDGGSVPENIAELQAMWDAGCTAFKAFTCNLHGVKAMSSGYLLEMFRTVASFGGTVLIHCEDDGILTAEDERLHREGRMDYMSQIEWRSPLAEEIAIDTVLRVCRATGARVIVAHVSSPHLLRKLADARAEGVSIYSETCAHYFYLSEEDLAKKGPWLKFTPPVTTKEKNEDMWRMLQRGLVTTSGSDHCPFPRSAKLPGEKNIWEAPNGIPGVETSMRLMLNGVAAGKISINRLVEVMAENPARVYGLAHRKGFIEVGKDADLVIVDMTKEQVLCDEQVVSKCGWTPYNGMHITGVPEMVFVRGELVAKDGCVVGKPGHGQFLHRGAVTI